eukprot:5564060-Prymnesium_polylepis.2
MAQSQGRSMGGEWAVERCDRTAHLAKLARAVLGFVALLVHKNAVDLLPHRPPHLHNRTRALRWLRLWEKGRR